VQKHELERVQSFLSATAVAKAELTPIQYATEQYPMPIQISPGIAGDVDPSTTLDEDVKERGLRNQKQGG